MACNIYVLMVVAELELGLELELELEWPPISLDMIKVASKRIILIDVNMVLFVMFAINKI